MAQTTVRPAQNTTSDTTRDPSPAIWGNCPWEAIEASPGRGMVFFDDFQSLPLAPTLTTQIAYGRYKAFANTGCTITRVHSINSTEVPGGALQLAIDTDNDSNVIAQAFPSYLLSGLTSNSGRLWFECCYAQNSVATNMASVFMGLAEVDLFTLANTVPFNAGDPIDNSGSMIGFHIKEDGTGKVDFVTSDRATSYTDVIADLSTENGSLLTANTFTKLGFFYDPNARDTTKMIRVFQDNKEMNTAVSKTTLTGKTNLDANCLGLLFGAVADSAGTSFKAWMKWWRVAYEFANAIL